VGAFVATLGRLAAPGNSDGGDWLPHRVIELRIRLSYESGNEIGVRGSPATDSVTVAGAALLFPVVLMVAVHDNVIQTGDSIRRQHGCRKVTGDEMRGDGVFIRAHVANGKARFDFAR